VQRERSSKEALDVSPALPWMTFPSAPIEIRKITGLNMQKLVTATGTGNNGRDWSMSSDSSPEVVHDPTVQGVSYNAWVGL